MFLSTPNILNVRIFHANCIEQNLQSVNNRKAVSYTVRTVIAFSRIFLSNSAFKLRIYALEAF